MQNVHAELAGRLDGLPRPGDLGRTEQHQRRFQRKRRERLAGEPGRRTVGHRGYHGDTGTELAEHIAECAWVHRFGGHDRYRYLNPMLKSWPPRLTAVLSRAPQSGSSTCNPSQPNSTSKPPGVFM